MNDGRLLTRIERFGWRGPLEPGIGRVVSAHGDYYHLVGNECPEGEILARKKKSAFTRMKTPSPANMKGMKVSEARASGPLHPISGDFVRFRHSSCGDSLVTEVLPRFSAFERRDPTARRAAQTLAVNFDTLFVMTGLDANFSEARVIRFLDLADGVGEAEVVVVVTKADLWRADDGRRWESLLKVIAGRARAFRISALTGEGMDEVARYVRPQRTLALVGSSGVGKSTLLNVLAGETVAATQEVQAWSGKGRHTTTSRELVMLPSGAMVLDTPGVREIGRVGEEDRILLRGESTHRYRR